MEAYNLIPKSEMKDKTWYLGQCRNTSVAVWDETLGKFRHLRYKQYWYQTEIPHFEDVRKTRKDGFIPVLEIPTIDQNKMEELKRKIGY